MDLAAFANEVGPDGPVTIAGLSSRGGGSTGVRTVQAPRGIAEFLPSEMTVRCGAGTPVDELAAVLGEAGQVVALPPGGTVGGALACGRSDVYRLGRGPVRDTLLQAKYVSAEGRIVKAGGPTVKNVSGFDLCRLLVGSWGTLGFLGEVILRTRPRPAVTRWFVCEGTDPFALSSRLYKAASILWDGARTHICLEGHAADVEQQRALLPGAREVEGPPSLPTGSRRSLRPNSLRSLTGSFVAEVGVGLVHHSEHWADRPEPTAAVRSLSASIKALYDPMGRLNPGIDVLDPDTLPGGAR